MQAFRFASRFLLQAGRSGVNARHLASEAGAASAHHLDRHPEVKSKCSVEGGVDVTKPSRIFAVVHLGGRQHKIAEEDTLVVNKLEVETGARIRLEKVLLAGSKDCTYFGTPLLSKSLIQVEATVVEQTKSDRVLVFKKKRRKNYKRKKGHRQDVTVLRINRIDMNTSVE
eukprot:m.54254 g.54254  ORF g.54254 m.54254 type:complete len:170 (+) comp34341_c0_seq5:11-520(+)